MFDKTRKIRPKAISHYKDCLFSPKLRVLNNLLRPKKTPSQVQESLPKILGTVLYCSLRVFTCDITRKDRPKFWSSWKQVFWNVCFYRPLGRQRNYLIICKININIPCVPKQFVPWHSSCSIKREKISQNFFFAGKAAFFSKHCFSNNLLGPEKRLL